MDHHSFVTHNLAAIPPQKPSSNTATSTMNDMASVFKAGHTALITGGASGIGLALAKRCHGLGMKVLVADWDEELLGSTSSNIGGAVNTFKMDVGKAEDWAQLKSKVDADFAGKINLLALNAGVGPKSSWDDIASFHKVLDTNLYGVINGISTCLPAVKATSPSAFVITGSKQGITNPPGNPAYNASKAAVKSLAEHLSYDLRNEKDIGVHLLVPGWTFTGLSGNRPGGGKEKPNGAWYPEQVVEYLEKKMAEGKFYVLCPDDDVTEELDRKRMLWSVGDALEGRPPLSRWREDWKSKAQEWIDKQ